MALSNVLLSGSAGGQLVVVASTGSPGTAIHATGNSASVIDRLYMWATNNSTVDIKLTLEYGSTSAATVEQTIPGEAGLLPIVEGLPMVGTGAAARTVRAYAATASVLAIGGYVIRVST